MNLLSEREGFGRAWEVLNVLRANGIQARAELYADASGRIIIPAVEAVKLTDEIARDVMNLAGSERWEQWTTASDLELASCQGFRVPR